MSEQPPEVSSLIRKVALKTVVYLVVLAIMLFGVAGRMDWAGAWIQLALSAGVSIGALVFIIPAHPDLVAERARIFASDELWDKILTPILAVVLPVATILVAALDARFGWSPLVPIWVMVLAVAVNALGTVLVLWALRVNKFFSSVVRIQRDRGHVVVTNGPYEWVRHPGYAGWIPVMLTTPLILESLWSLVPAVLSVILIILRTVLEDRTLTRELEGYADYARRVPWRLLPGVW